MLDGSKDRHTGARIESSSPQLLGRILLAGAVLLGTVACGGSPATLGAGTGSGSGSIPVGDLTLSALTADNTAACPAGGTLPAQCEAPFTGQTDTRSLVATPRFDPPAGNVSTEDLHSYLSNGSNTKIYANFMLAYCVAAGQAYCHNNVLTGYTSDDTATVAAQAEDLIRRHIDGAIMTWEGAGSGADSATLKFQAYVNANHCTGPQQCAPMYLIMLDGPSMAYSTTATGIPGTSGASCSGLAGTDYENCVVAHIRNDICYMNGKHWGNNAYLKANGRPVLQVFPDEGVIPSKGPAPSWSDVWVQIASWNSNLPQNCSIAPYNANNGVPLVVFEDSGGFTHQSSSGSFYWVHPAGTDPATDQDIYNISPASSGGTLDNFFTIAQQYGSEQPWGAGFKGFNSFLSVWGADRIMDQQCGQTWISSLTQGNQYYANSTLPFLQIATWNDYNEGTEIETGIDNCYGVSASVSGKTLSWSLNANRTQASLSTVSRMEIYDSSDGEHLSLLATQPVAASGTYSLSGLASGKHTLYVRMLGKNSILNRISAGVSYAN